MQRAPPQPAREHTRRVASRTKSVAQLVHRRAAHGRRGLRCSAARQTNVTLANAALGEFAPFRIKSSAVACMALHSQRSQIHVLGLSAHATLGHVGAEEEAEEEARRAEQLRPGGARNSVASASAVDRINIDATESRIPPQDLLLNSISIRSRSLVAFSASQHARSPSDGRGRTYAAARGVHPAPVVLCQRTAPARG